MSQSAHTPPNAPVASKQSWRHWAKRVREQQHTQPELTTSIISNLQEHPAYQNATHVLIYLAFKQELNLSRLWQNEPNKQFYATRTHIHNKTLSVHALDTPLEKHPLGFLQPVASAPVIQPEHLDMVLVPGLCFDYRGFRLGYGGGFYDRFLPLLRPDAIRVGVSTRALLVPKLPTEPHDCQVQFVVTEHHMHTCSTRDATQLQ